MKKRPLTPEEIQECQALKAIFMERRHDLKLTQEKAAEALGMNQGSLSHYLNCRNALNADFAAKAAKLLHVPVERFSPRLSRAIAEMAEANSPRPAGSVVEMASQLVSRVKGNIPDGLRESLIRAAAELEKEKTGSNVITADFSRPPLVGDEIRIAHYDVQGAMGSGKLVHDFPEMFRDVTVSQQHLRELGVTYTDPNHLKLITGSGQSMAPTIQDKDPMIIDVSVREFAGDGVYAFTWQGHFYIKRLQVADAEHFEMISDNPQHKDRMIRMDETYVQGKILLVWQAQRV